MPRLGTYRTGVGLVELESPRDAERSYFIRRGGRRALRDDLDGDDYGIFQTDVEAREQGRAQRAALARLAESLGPSEARRLGVPEDEARRQMEGGVAYPEGAMHWLARNTVGRLTGGFDEPTGEEADVRIARLEGRAAAGESEEKRRMTLAKLLFDVADQLEDPNAVSGQAAESLKALGLEIDPEAMKFRERVPGSEFEALAEGEGNKYHDAVEKKYALDWAAREAGRTPPAPPKLSVVEQLAVMYEARGMAPEKALEKAMRTEARNKAAGTLRADRPTRASQDAENVAMLEDTIRREQPGWDAGQVRQEALSRLRKIQLYGEAGTPEPMAPPREDVALAPDTANAMAPMGGGTPDPMVDDYMDGAGFPSPAFDDGGGAPPEAVRDGRRMKMPATKSDRNYYGNRSLREPRIENPFFPFEADLREREYRKQRGRGG